MSNQNNTPAVDVAALQAQLAALAAENDALKAKNAPKPVTMKVSENKGCLSVYGINSRFPVSLYANQWERLLSHADEIRAFIAANAGRLATKD